MLFTGQETSITLITKDGKFYPAVMLFEWFKVNENDKAYIRDVILVLKRVVKIMPDEMIEEKQERGEFEIQIRLAESQILKLKRELSLR